MLIHFDAILHEYQKCLIQIARLIAPHCGLRMPLQEDFDMR